MTPYYLNVDAVAVSDDGVASGATAFGRVLAEGSTLPDFEIATEALMSGHNIATGIAGSYVIRVLNADETVLADLEEAVDDCTYRYLHFNNRGDTRRFNIGPVMVTAAHERPPTGTAARGAALVAFNVANDRVSDVFSVDDLTVTT